MTFLENLDWRFAAKSFDPNKIVPEKDFQTIKDSIRMTPTSFGLQPFQVKVVTDQAVQEALLPHSWNQPQVTTCSHLLVFCADTRTQRLIDRYFETASGGNNEIRQKMKGYEDMMHGSLDPRSDEALLKWAQNQIYIALGFAMAACAELKIDSCPMEGFSAEEYDKILDLPDYLKSTVVLPIGYREEDPARAKVRAGEDELFF